MQIRLEFLYFFIYVSDDKCSRQQRRQRDIYFLSERSLPMGKKEKKAGIAVFACIAIVLLAGALLSGSSGGKHETIEEVMRDAVLHESNRISFLGMKDVNPAFISAVTVTGILLSAAALIRIFVIPRFQYVPGRFQLLLEELVGLFDGLAKSNSPHRNGFLGIYVFTAGTYIFEIGRASCRERV